MNPRSGRAAPACPLVVAALVWLVAPVVAHATRPTLNDLDAMPFALDCRDLCDTRPAIERPSCLSGCSYQVAPGWEKNAIPPVDRQDYALAVLEYWDGGEQTHICYESGAVVSLPACGAVNCLAHHTKAECADADHDGLPAWQEALVGTHDDNQADVTLCTSNGACGFDAQCEFEFQISKSLCRPRPCAETLPSTCTAFHLEKIASNAQELVVQVHFDYSPVPATVLDLRLLYSAADLTLVDARALTILSNAGKMLSVTHPAAGVLRLVVLGTGSSLPVPHGAIVELAFQRTSSRATELKFDLADFYQRASMAPVQGDTQAALATDRFWGAAIALGGTDANSARLVLAYAFDSLTQPLEYSGVPSAESLCELVGPNVDRPRFGGQVCYAASASARTAASYFIGLTPPSPV